MEFLLEYLDCFRLLFTLDTAALVGVGLGLGRLARVGFLSGLDVVVIVCVGGASKAQLIASSTRNRNRS